MDWNAAIEKNREALKRVLTMLVAMAVGTRGQFTFFPQDGALSQGLALAEKSKLSPAPTLPRHLHRAVLRLLRPAEAAARRLVIVAARDLIVPPPAPPRPRKPKPASAILRNGTGTGIRTGILMPPLPQSSLPRTAPRALALPLFDPLRLPSRHRPVARSVPRISAPGYGVRFPVAARRPLSPGDPIDARRLGLRLQALGRALDRLPDAARRFARWRGRVAAGAQNTDVRDSAGAQNKKARGPFRRVWPLRPGRPPGWRRNPVHEVHEILNVAHGLAIWALQRPDTS